jgi:hypothetical protein
MRHSQPFILAAMILISGTGACGWREVSPLEPGVPAFATRSDRNNVREPFFITLDNPCTPEVESIAFEGTIHGQGSTWDNGHFKSHYNVNLTGIDANGVRYRTVSTGNGNGGFPGSPSEDVIISTVINSQGGTDNFITKIVLHFAADGTVQVDNSSEQCRG